METPTSPPEQWKRLEINSSDMITVVVGTEQETYYFHTSLVASSAYLSAKISPRTANQPISIPVPNLQPKQFDYYAKWLYSREAVLDADVRSLEDVNDYRLAVELYILGCDLLDRDFRNDVSDRLLKLLEVSGRFLDHLSINRIWQRASQLCPLRDLVIDWWAPCTNSHHLANGWECLPSDFTKRLYQAMIVLRESKDEDKIPRPTYAHRCKYHEHVGDSAKCL